MGGSGQGDSSALFNSRDAIAPQNFLISMSMDTPQGWEGVPWRTVRTMSRAHADQIQTLRVSENNSAFIYTGQAVPVISKGPWGSGDGVGIDYKPYAQGYHVTPVRLSHNKIKLIIH